MLVSNIDLSRVDIEELCREGKLVAVRYFLKKGVSVNKDSLYVASSGGHLEVVKELISYKAPAHEFSLRDAKTEEIKEVLREYVSK